MKWFSTGPALSMESVRRFEEQTNRRVPNAILWFLSKECNGGWPGGQYLLPTDEPGNKYACLHGICGVGDSRHDLAEEIKWWPKFRADMWPIGYDDFSGRFVLMLSGQQKGQVRFMPYDHFVDPDSNVHFFVARNVKAFSEMLKNPSLPEIEL